ncbi:hypothetical protein Fuma_00058 [Fuerstiella marisgermanici]|uniref:Uncharacterized protein n=1 Tax=Fuerstiella marisgermanici TaxID=1891926 RepID=A0A1P8W8U6_9PLAN|nr:hypothetical protein Fuma_00058 [Fuerstiella marisgermanici]
MLVSRLFKDHVSSRNIVHGLARPRKAFQVLIVIAELTRRRLFQIVGLSITSDREKDNQNFLCHLLGVLGNKDQTIGGYWRRRSSPPDTPSRICGRGEGRAE